MGGPEPTRARRARATSTSPVDHGTPAPGKTTGIPIVDHGVFCTTQGTHPGCFLDDTQRAMLMVALTTVVGQAMDNFRDAIQNVRLALLTTVAQSKSGWGAFAEILFQSLSGGIIGALMKSLTALQARAADVVGEGGVLTIAGLSLSSDMARRVAAIQPEHITGVAVQASKGLRQTLKSAAHGPAGVSQENVDAAAFLKIIQDGIGPTANQLVLEAPAAMTDGELAAMVAAYQDPAHHSVAAYEANLQDLIDRYRAQHLADIGTGRSNGVDQMTHKQATHVVAGTRSRLAILHYFDPVFDPAGRHPEPGATSHKLRETDGTLAPWRATEFVAWVDDDLGGVALDYQAAAYGHAPVLDASRADTGMTQIDDWARGAP